MKYRLLQWLACPACRSPELRVETRKSRELPITGGHFDPSEGEPAGVDLSRGVETEIVDGALHCGGCGAIYPVRDGVPRMFVGEPDAGQSTAHRWTTFDTGAREWEQCFRDYADPLEPKDFLGKVVLDAGCGYGRHAYYAARYGAEVVALDSSGEAISAAAENTHGSTRMHLVQGDLRHPPFRFAVFDLVYCFGVLHHLQDPDAAFASLGEVVRSGGKLAVWVYGQRQGVTLAVSEALRSVTTGLEADELHRLSQVIAGGLRMFSHTPYRVFRGVPVAGSVVSHLPVHDHHKWPFAVVVADVFDRLRVPVRHWFSRARLETMMVNAGYADVHVSRRVANNESFRALGTRR